MKVWDVMQKDVKSCNLDSTLESIAVLMWDNNCGSIPVLDHEGHPVGMITDRDIAMSAALNHKPLWDISAREVIGDRQIYVAHPEDDVKAAMKTMWSQKVRRMPVVDNNGLLTGILSVDDLVHYAERGTRGQRIPDLSYDDAVNTMKAVSYYH